jgi:type IV pilus assembly protein PilC
VYPIVLVCLSGLILFLLVAFALPKLADVFTSGGFNPPLFSRIVFSVGLFLNRTVFITAPIFLMSVTGLWVFFTRSSAGGRIFWRIVTHLPIVGNVIYRISIQRFASTFASLLKSGMPIIEALETTADAVGSEELKAALMRISRDGISKGLTIGEAFQREAYLPKVVVNLIAISEKAGHIETILDTLAEFMSPK